MERVKYVFILTLLMVGAAAGLWGSAIVVRWNDNMTQTPRIMPGERSFPMPTGVVPRGGELIMRKEQRDGAAKKPNPVKTSDASIAIGRERFVTYCVPCHGAEAKGGTTGPVAAKFIPTPDPPDADPDERRAAEAADRRLLAQLHRRRRRRHARLRRGALVAGSVAHRELPSVGRDAMNVFWGVVALLGAIVFLVGANSADASQVWSIYLVNLVFWSGLAVTGPAIAGMMQVTEARWSPSVRRIALTTAGFLPTSFVLFLVLFAGQTVLYPWVTTPIPAKAAWLNPPFFLGRTWLCGARLFAVG